MINTPALKSCFRVETIPSEGVFLLSEFGQFVLAGRANELVVPLIDGKRSADAIAQELSRHIPLEQVYYALLSLEQKGFISEAHPDASSVWGYLGAQPQAVRERLDATQVEVLAIPNLDRQPMVQALASHGVQLGSRQDFTVVLTSDYLHPELKHVNQRALRQGKPWILINPFAANALIGPIFLPGRTGCWECLAQRIRINRPLEAYLENKGRKPQHSEPAPFSTSTLPVIAGLGAFHIAKFIALGSNPQLEGKLISLDLTTMVTLTHHMVKRPQCPTCGDGELLMRQPPVITLQSRPKLFTVDGGHRVANPHETFAKYQHHVSPITGIVNELAPIPNPSGDLVNVYVAGHNFAMQSDSLHLLQENLRSKSAGKGMTDVQARTSALCEALERYSGVFRGEEPHRKATFYELAGSAIHPNDCMNFSARQYEQRQEWAKRGSPFHIVPNPFDPKARIDWTPVWSFRSQSYKYLPTSYCYYGYPSTPETVYCWADSNGCAAGNTLEEAMLQGFLELVERDAVGIWWYNQLWRPGVDLASFHEPYIDKLLAFYASMGREVWVLNVTSDFEIPTFAALSRKVHQPQEEIIFGFGSHLDARIALLRALTEMNQFLPAVSGVDTHGVRQYAYPDQSAIEWWKKATLQNQPYLAPRPDAPLMRYTDFPRVSNGDILEDVRYCINKTGELGMETLLLDQTRPDVDLKVVKVIVPGMRHFWARFGKGRLYDVPVKMGWLPYPRREEQLNPVLMFI